MMKPPLTLDILKREARDLAIALSSTPIESLYGVTDGKAVGTYVEQLFREILATRYAFTQGSSALGIDFPDPYLWVDVKVTSIRQPQSSSPYRDASQKVYGLGYNLLIIVYDKVDDPVANAARLAILHVVFVTQARTADYQTTFGILEILRRNGNVEDIAAFLEERNLPLDEVGRLQLAQRILQSPPEMGYLTISNALQWRLQYSRVITASIEGSVDGLERLLE